MRFPAFAYIAFYGSTCQCSDHQCSAFYDFVSLMPACRLHLLGNPYRRCVVLSVLFLWFLVFGWQAVAAQTAQQIRQGKRATAYVELPSLHASGTAFCISPQGFFVTNEHVVRGLDRNARITLVLNPGETNQVVASAHLVRANAAADLALLKLDGEHKSLAWLELDTDKELTETAPVTAFGYPFGQKLREGDSDYPNITVNVGRVTALRKSNGLLQRIQLDAPLHPGNSGSPVVDAQGRVVGIVEGGMEAADITFAIPARRLDALLSAMSVMDVSLSPRDVFACRMASAADFYRADAWRFCPRFPTRLRPCVWNLL